MPKTKRWRETSKIEYHGLINQGSTCYLNSVLQVLFMTKDFREAVKRENEENTEFMACLQELFKNLEKRTAHTDAVTAKLGIDRVYEQQDAAVYYEKILRLTSPEASQIFNGKLAYRTTCVQCNTRTERDWPFWHLPLALVDPGSKSYSVEDGIKEYFKASHLNEENQLYCDKCDDKTDAVTIPVIKHHPEVLMLLLKRFKKINCSVDVPYSLQIPESQTYELYAVVDHFGDLRSGHYTATIKDKNDNEDRWYNFNDSRVSPPFQVDTTERSQSAYLLFYRKKKNADTPDSQEVSHAGGVKLTTKNHNEMTDEQRYTMDIKTKDKTCGIKPLTQNFNRDTEQQDNGGLGTIRGNRNDDKLKMRPRVYATKGNEKAKRDGESEKQTRTGKVGNMREKLLTKSDLCSPAKDHENRRVDIKYDMTKDGLEYQQGRSNRSTTKNKQQREERDGSEDKEQKRRNDEHAGGQKSTVGSVRGDSVQRYSSHEDKEVSLKTKKAKTETMEETSHCSINSCSREVKLERKFVQNVDDLTKDISKLNLSQKEGNERPLGNEGKEREADTGLDLNAGVLKENNIKEEKTEQNQTGWWCFR